MIFEAFFVADGADQEVRSPWYHRYGGKVCQPHLNNGKKVTAINILIFNLRCWHDWMR
jgi:hypothetical protein